MGSSAGTFPWFHSGFAGGSLWLLSCLKMQDRDGPGWVSMHPLGWPPQDVAEHGAAALDLNFTVLLASNNYLGMGLCSARVTC